MRSAPGGPSVRRPRIGAAFRSMGTAVAIGLALAAVPGGASAQQEPQPDSTEDRIRERLQRLSRPPGYDSVLFVQDSLRLAEAQAGVRPQLQTGQDSVLSALSGMPGYTLTRYEAQAAEFEAAERMLSLTAPPEGRARVSREGIEVEADSAIVFDETTGRMRTRGMATFTPPDDEPVDALDLIYDLGEARGTARGARTEFTEGGTTWFMSGDMPWAGQDSTFLAHARFTSCDLEDPHYHFETDQIKLVGGRILVARGVRLYFADVPVAWLPFIAQDLEQGRASGLLTPRFSVNDIVRTSGSYRRRISNLGFYWAMSDYTDALLALDWFSDTFVALEGGFQYRWNRQFLNGSANVRRYWGSQGNDQFALDTYHDWQPNERTNLNIAANYATSTDFVRETSFDPREVTQSITSTGSLTRRFDWGQLTLGSTRNEYLSDDRVEWTLPSGSLQLTSRTLFPAPTSDARFWNNMTWSASTSYSRQTTDYLQPDTFTYSLADVTRTNASVSTSLRVGNFSFSPRVGLQETETMGVPEALLVVAPGETPDPSQLVTGAPARDIAQATATWGASLSYQQRLVGSTTLTPQLSVNGSLFRSDTSTVASSFVGAPSRVSLGARLRSDIYGFFPGFGPFDAIRHKISPEINYEWTPEATPTPLQREVFGPRAIQPRNIVSVGFNQTFEARRRQEDEDTTRADVPGPEGADAAAAGLTPRTDTVAAGPRRIPRAPVTTLLGLSTSIVRYDFVEADSLGQFLAGFQTTELQSQITSDYLRGLSVSVAHDLFADSLENGAIVERRFAPHLSSVNLGFSLGSNSAVFRWLGLTGGDQTVERPDDEVEEEEFEDPFEDGMLGEASVIPGRAQGMRAQETDRGRSGVGEWNASLSYSLRRPRDRPDAASQMLSGTVRMRPTENWDLSWRTSYDLEASAFNDHIVRLTRDLHRWQAHFDFVQTATGNWTFRFEVSLQDNRDLRFDYRQRNLDVGLPRATESP